ncbi:MAG: zf-HC2 domain-containing protein, partial [Deltaproteobacteria bacterium]|nr:zf-HC2 domain-containing protein [Deltaproteobacteria bacterium]
MECKDAKERLVAHLSGELRLREEKKLVAHLASCSACSEDKEALGRIWKELGNLPEAMPPAELRVATTGRIEAMLREEQPSELSAKLESGRWPLKPLGAIFGAVAMAFVSLWVLRGVTPMERLSAELVFLCAALWTGVLGLTFLFATGAVPSLNPTWRGPARIALTGFAFAMVGIVLCPKMSLIEWWESVAPGEFLLRFGPSISHAAFGALYAFLPFFLAVLLFARKLGGDFFSQLLAAGILYLVLLFPGILLQALPLSYFV